MHTTTVHTHMYTCAKFEISNTTKSTKNIQETARTFEERFKEHLKAPSPIYDHGNITGHSTTLNNFSIVGREEQNLSRLIKESMYIRVNCSEISLLYAYILDNFNSDFNFDFNSNSKCSHI